MILLYEDNKHMTLNESVIKKPILSFDYYFIVFDTEKRNEPEAEIVVDEDGNQLSSDEAVRAIPNQWSISPDSYNQAMTPEQEAEIQDWVDNYLVEEQARVDAEEAYKLTDEYFETVMKQQKLDDLKVVINSNTRPRVKVVLSNTTTYIDGGRADKDNFKEEFERMKRKGISTTYIKDANNNIVISTVDDVRLCYEAIVDNFSDIMSYKWLTQTKIENATTREELEQITLMRGE